jgi:XRE family transcriptional regulator, regulator of sulfur utilization
MVRAKAPKAGFQPSQNQLALETRIREALPAILVAERESQRLTQEQLAERAGIHVTTIGKIERGQQVPSLALLVLLAKALGCSPEELLRKVLPETSPPKYEDRAIALVRGFPAADRARLVPVLEAFVDLKRRP